MKTENAAINWFDSKRKKESAELQEECRFEKAS